MNYVKPTIRFYDKFDDLDNEQESYAYIWHKTNWDDIFLKNRIILLAEPGYGKTRMLKEVVLESTAQKKEAIFIDLKKISGHIEDFINEYHEKYEFPETLDTEEKINECNQFKSKNFKLDNSENTIICFDALDEVQIGEKFAKLSNDLNDFSKKYDKCKIIISCRTHHYKRYKSILAGTNFNFCKIFDFQQEQIENFLKKQQPPISLANIEKIMENIALANCRNILGTPRYLFMFVKMIEEKGVDKVLQLNKTDLFESFIYGKLEREIGEHKIDVFIFKRVLEKLALIMEIYQSYILTKDELLTFFDNIESNLSRAFLEVYKWQALTDKSLIKDNIDVLQFENREFQEYLAAKELTRIAKNEQALYDLVIDGELKEVIPSWFNTLGFFIELDITKLKQFLELGKQKSDSVQDKEYHKLITFVKTDRLDETTKREIFGYVFNYYQNELIPIEYDVAEKLAFYYSSSVDDLLLGTFNKKAEISESQYTRSVNALRIIMYLLKYNILRNNRESFKTCLVDLIKDCDKSLQHNILMALRYFNDFSLIENIIQYYDVEDSSNLEYLILTLKDIQPNSEMSLTIFSKGTKKRIISSRYGLYKLTNSGLIEKLIQNLIEDDELLRQFLYFESIFDEKEHQLIENIQNAINDSLLDHIENLIFKIYKDYEHYEAWDSRYVKKLIDLLKSKRRDILFRIISRAKVEGIVLNNSVFHECFKLLLSKQNLEQFIKEIGTFNEGRWFALNIFLSYSNDSEIYKKGISYLSKENEEYERRRTEFQKQYPSVGAKEFNVYELFKHKLGSKEKWYTDVFEFYLQNEKQLSLIPEEDIERLKERVFIVLKQNPLEGRVKFTNKQGSETSYTMTLHMSLFKECLVIAKKFGWDLSHVQQNIFNCIPCAYDQELELIFESLNDVTRLDVKPILDVYITRKDDLSILRPESFMRACDKYKILLAVPILEGFVNNKNLSVQERKLAIEVMTSLKPNTEKLNKYFKKYCSTTANKQLAEKANELLIGLNDNDAIAWRIQELKHKAIKVLPYKNCEARCLSKGESELHHKDFAKPLLNLCDQRFFDQFIDLLKYSFDKVKENNEYWEYSNYVWDIVCEYIYNLRTNRKYEPLLRLEKKFMRKE
jgi:hypothetical protein